MQLRCRRCHHPFFFDSLSLSNHHVEYLWESHDMSRLSTQTFFFSILCNCTTTATHFLRHPSDKALRFFIPRKLVTAHAMRQRECKKSKKRRRLPASAQRGFVWGPQNLQFKFTIIYIPIFLVFSQVILQVIPIWSHYFQLVEIVTPWMVASAHPIGWTFGHTWITWYALQESQMDDRLEYIYIYNIHI